MNEIIGYLIGAFLTGFFYCLLLWKDRDNDSFVPLCMIASIAWFIVIPLVSFCAGSYYLFYKIPFELISRIKGAK